MIYYGRQSVSEEDIQKVIDVLHSDFLTQGPAVVQFEKCVADYCGAKYAVAVANGTAALHVACLAAGLGTGDMLWTSPITFVASANCARYCGADVDFVDVDANTYNMSAEALEVKLRSTKIKPKMVVPVHLAGQSCDMKRIHELAQKYGFMVLEDACHGTGAEYLGKKVGCCEFSDMTVFSFHPVKIVTTGEGGMILTNNEAIYRRLQLFRNHGITRDESMMTKESDGPWYYQQLELGFNYRMTDIQAALGYSQMQRVDEFVQRRRYLAERYNRLLKDLPLKTPYVAEFAEPSWHIYVVRIDFKKVRKSKQEIFAAMKKAGVALNLHYIPIHMQPYYRRLGFREGAFPQSETYYHEAMTLPLYYELSDEQQDEIVECLRDALA